MYNTDKIRELNDIARRTFTGLKVVATPGIAALPGFAEILNRVRQFDTFDRDNDPHAEHDFGAFTYLGHQVFFKFDYYNQDLNGGSPAPADEAVTKRVLTIMLADEY
jgi:hypothetical protein